MTQEEVIEIMRSGYHLDHNVTAAIVEIIPNSFPPKGTGTRGEIDVVLFRRLIADGSIVKRPSEPNVGPGIDRYDLRITP